MKNRAKATRPGDRRLRILYAAGPGDVVGMYRNVLAGREPSDEMSIAFSKQFMQWCDEQDGSAHLMSSNGRRDVIRNGRYLVENRPKPSFCYKGGLRYHLGSVAYGLTVIATAIRERPSVVVVDSGTTHWIVLSLLSALRIPVIAVLHNALWPMGYPPIKRSDRALIYLDGVFFRRFAAATVCVSPECERQVRTVARAPKGPICQCRAQYRAEKMRQISAVPPQKERPFRVLFVGRVEENKGVFLILAIAERLEITMPGAFRWKIVGTGSAMETLGQQIAQRHLISVVELAGRCTGDSLLEAYSWAHANIVPTTSHFKEAFAQTAAEAVLAGRPVVVSAVVPAWEVLGSAAIRAETDNVDSFVDAFRRLAAEPAYYEHCRQATSTVQEQFYRPSEGLGAVVGYAISTVIR